MKKIVSLVVLFILSFAVVANVSAAEYGTRVRVDDASDIFTSNQEDVLDAKMDAMALKYEFDFHLLTIDSLPSGSNQQQQAIEYIADYYERMGYGNPYASGKKADVIIILLATNNTSGTYKRWVEISCYGDTDKYLSNQDCYDVTASFSGRDYTNSNSWYNATEEMLDDMLSTIKYNVLMSILIPQAIIFGVATLITVIIGFGLVYSSKPQKTVSNRTYMNKNSAKVLGRYDRYINTITTRVPRSSSSGGSGGGGGGGGRSSGGGRGF